MRIYYDTEFLEDGHTIDLISIGLVREDGAEYYAVSGEFNQKRVREHDWLRVNVWPYLPQVPKPYNPELYYLDNHHPAVKGRQQIAAEVKEFVLEVPSPELWAYYGAYDHVALAQLYGTMMALPKGFPMRTKDVEQEMDRLGVTKDQLPIQGGNLHEAIDDARWNKLAHEYLLAYEESDQRGRAAELAELKKALDESESKRTWLARTLQGFGV